MDDGDAGVDDTVLFIVSVVWSEEDEALQALMKKAVGSNSRR